MWGMLDLPKEPIVISDTEIDENKALEQHPVKFLPNYKLELLKNNQMLTDYCIYLVQEVYIRCTIQNKRQSRRQY